MQRAIGGTGSLHKRALAAVLTAALVAQTVGCASTSGHRNQRESLTAGQDPASTEVRSIRFRDSSKSLAKEMEDAALESVLGPIVFSAVVLTLPIWAPYALWQEYGRSTPLPESGVSTTAPEG